MCNMSRTRLGDTIEGRIHYSTHRKEVAMVSSLQMIEIDMIHFSRARSHNKAMQEHTRALIHSPIRLFEHAIKLSK